MIKEKLNWVDNLKAIGIFAVILGHISSPFSAFIYSWHMPLFFILAGFFINLVFYFGIPTLDMANKNYENAFLNIIYAISIIFVLILILKKLDLKSELLTIWGGNTMLLFIIHPYTNNISHIIVEKLHFGDWYLKFFISLVFLQGVLFIKQRFENRGIFRYV